MEKDCEFVVCRSNKQSPRPQAAGEGIVIYVRCRGLVVLGTKLAYHLGGAPHLAVVQGGQFLLQAYAVVGL